MKEIILWLFKDPINSGLVQFDHDQSNSKKWPKGHCPNFSFCKIFKKFSEPIQSYEDVPFSRPDWLICPEQNFFLVQIIVTTFI